MGRTRREKFWKKTNLPAGCWEWTGAIKKVKGSKGYGNFWDGTKTVIAHRYAYEAFYGQIPVDLQVNHRCNNSLCVNPMHLYAGTQSENNYDRADLGLNTGEKHWNAKLTEEAVAAIRSAGPKPHLAQFLAEEYGVSKTTIYSIRKGERWKHVSRIGR